MKPFRFLLLLAGLGLLLPPSSSAATAEEKIPALAVVPTALPHDDYMLYERGRQRLEEEYAAFRQAAGQFSARAATDQSEAEFATLMAAKQRVIVARLDFNRTVNSRIDALSAAAGLKPFALPQISIRGDFRILTGDGRVLTAETIAGAHLDNRARAVTGPNAHAVLILPDDTSFVIGPSSEIVLDDFVYDPETRASKVAARLAKGVFRWVTGKLAPRDPSSMRVTTPVIAIITKGTDFSCELNPDGSGAVRLYSGELELQDAKTGAKSLLQAGYVVTFAEEKTSAPARLPPAAEKSAF